MSVIKKYSDKMRCLLSFVISVITAGIAYYSYPAIRALHFIPRDEIVITILGLALFSLLLGMASKTIIPFTIIGLAPAGMLLSIYIALTHRAIVYIELVAVIIYTLVYNAKENIHIAGSGIIEFFLKMLDPVIAATLWILTANVILSVGIMLI